MNEADKERLNKRLGWMLCELGKEDAEIIRLKESLKVRIGRRNAMEVECDRICKELGMDVPEKKTAMTKADWNQLIKELLNQFKNVIDGKLSFLPEGNERVKRHINLALNELTKK